MVISIVLMYLTVITVCFCYERWSYRDTDTGAITSNRREKAKEITTQPLNRLIYLIKKWNYRRDDDVSL